MLEKLMATAVLPASDIARAKQWWHDVLDRDPVYSDPEGEAEFFDVGGIALMVYRTDYLQNRGEIDELTRTAANKQCSIQSPWTSGRTIF